MSLDVSHFSFLIYKYVTGLVRIFTIEEILEEITNDQYKSTICSFIDKCNVCHWIFSIHILFKTISFYACKTIKRLNLYYFDVNHSRSFLILEINIYWTALLRRGILSTENSFCLWFLIHIYVALYFRIKPL